MARKVVNPGGSAQNVSQPLPMPVGVATARLVRAQTAQKRALTLLAFAALAYLATLLANALRTCVSVAGPLGGAAIRS